VERGGWRVERGPQPENWQLTEDDRQGTRDEGQGTRDKGQRTRLKVSATTRFKTVPVPSLDEIYRLTGVPEERALFRDVDWSVCERLVDSIPESSNIHVHYDGKVLEVVAKGKRHERFNWLLERFVDVETDELDIACEPLGETTWKRMKAARGLGADQSYYFLAEKLEAGAAASERGSDDIADDPNPDLAIEVDNSEPRVNGPAIYAALQVAEVWRCS
jgi:Uma2 family endonuclease